MTSTVTKGLSGTPNTYQGIDFTALISSATIQWQSEDLSDLFRTLLAAYENAMREIEASFVSLSMAATLNYDSLLYLQQRGFDAATSVSDRISTGAAYVTPGERKLPPVDLVRRLLSFLDLQPGWDGYAGRAVQNDTILAGLEALNFFYDRAGRDGVTLSPPAISPSSDGSVFFEWDISGNTVIVEIPPPPESPSFYSENRGGSINEAEAASLEDLWQAIRPALSA